MATKDKMFSRRKSLALFRDGGTGNTTLANPASAGATTITLTSATGFAQFDAFRIGSGETIERADVGSISGVTITLSHPLRIDHAAGEAVVEQVGYNLGSTTGGLQDSPNVETTDVTADDQRLLVDRLTGYSSREVSTAVHGLTPELLAFALGIPLSAVSGTGADVDNPKTLITDFNDVDTVDNMSVVAQHVLQDGTVRVQEWWGISANYTQFSVQLATGVAVSVPFRFSVYGRAIEYDGAPVFVASTTFRAAKGKLFGNLSGIGTFPDTGGFTPTTVASTAAIGATSITLTDASALAAQDFIRIRSQDTIEIVWLKTVNTGTGVCALKAPLKRAATAGDAVSKVTKTKFVGVTKNGATLSIGGNRTALYDGTRQLSIGTQPETVDVSVAFALQSLALADRQKALGLASSALSGSVLTTSEGLGAASLNAVYAEGQLRDATTNLAIFGGCAQDLANAAMTFGGGQETAMPFAAKPSAFVAIYQYS
jgi:hypothetical protein